ncbi:MAG: universal stress protein [Myxococcota bacterium]|jgi:nucleotide-binding universal stress UspA family protein
MKTILVAVDGSEPSLKGVRTAVELAKAMGLGLELVYVLKPILLPPTAYAEAIQRVEEGNRLLAEDALKAAVKVVTDLGSTCETTMLHGAPAEAIADLADEPRVWGVVIGAKGHNAVSRVMLGSVADRLVHVCKKPVLVVR